MCLPLSLAGSLYSQAPEKAAYLSGIYRPGDDSAVLVSKKTLFTQ